MRSVTSFFNAGLLRKDLSRFWPLWAVYTAIWMLAMPLMELMELTNSYRRVTVAELPDEILSLASNLGLSLALVFGVLLAMALFSYLCNSRSTGMMHSFPIRREGLFLTHYAAGLVMFFAAHVLVLAMTAAVQGACGGYVTWRPLAVWLAAVTCLTFFFFTFAVFCAMFTGQILAIPVFYGVLNVLAVGMEYLVRTFASMFFYGAKVGEMSLLSQKLSPVVYLGRHLGPEYERYETQGYSTSVLTGRLEGMDALLWYALAAVVLAILSLLIYRLRHSETAGDTVTVGWARCLFRYGVAVCCALSLGQGLYTLVLGNYLSQMEYSLPGMLICMLVTGLMGYFAAEMLLRKTFRVLRPGWKGAAALSAALVLFGVAISLDLTGYEARVPSADQIESITYGISGVDYVSGEAAQPEDVELLRAAHQAMIGEKALQKERGRMDRADLAWDQGPWNYVSVTLEYYLNNGRTLSRRYGLYCQEEDRSREDSALSKLEAFTGTERVLWDYVMDLDGEMWGQLSENVVGGALDFPKSGVNGGWNWETVEMDGEVARAVLAAVEEDLAAGRFQFGLLTSEESETYSNSLYFYYSYRTKEGVTSSSVWIRGFGPGCTATTAALEEAGVLDGAHRLITEQKLSSYETDHEYGQSVEGTEVEAGQQAPAAVTVDTALEPIRARTLKALVG